VIDAPWRQAKHGSNDARLIEIAREELRIRRANPASQDLIAVGRCMNNLGMILYKAGQLADAEATLLEAQRQLTENVGADNEDTATSLFWLGRVYLDRGERERGARAVRKAYKIQEARLGPRHPTVVGMATLMTTLRM
jgi:hypothetical protein